MKDSYHRLFDGNLEWVESMLDRDPRFFHKLAKGQDPDYLWIGCSDSRVPADIITGTGPGEMFVHRNIANLVVHTDFNMLSVLQYAVEVLGVRHVIVCGHYGCGGVRAAMTEKSYGLIDNWLRHIKDVQRYHEVELQLLDEETRFKRLVELNVLEQVDNLRRTSTIQDAWSKGPKPQVHGLVYGLDTGYLHEVRAHHENTGEMVEDDAVPRSERESAAGGRVSRRRWKEGTDEALVENSQTDTERPRTRGSEGR